MITGVNKPQPGPNGLQLSRFLLNFCKLLPFWSTLPKHNGTSDDKLGQIAKWYKLLDSPVNINPCKRV